jgi:hypothetical protein
MIKKAETLIRGRRRGPAQYKDLKRRTKKMEIF